MRSSILVALSAVAVAAPAYAAPVHFARDTTSTSQTSSGNESDAISLGTVSTIASVAAPIVSGIIDHFKNNGNSNQRREAMEIEALLARSCGIACNPKFIFPVRDDTEDGLLARDSGDQSDALSLGVVKDIASIGSSVVSAVHNLFSGNNQQKQRDVIEILARDTGEESDALSLNVVKDVASIGSSVVSAVHSLFSGNNQQRRDMLDFEARADDESDAISLKTIGSIASFAAPVVGGIIDHFTNNGQQQSREFFERELSELMARDGSDESDALSLKTVGTIASFAAPVVGGIIDHFTNKGNGQQSRNFLDEYVTRSLNDLD